MIHQILCAHHQIHQIAGIIADAWREKLSVLLLKRQLCSIREHDIRMRCEDHQLLRIRIAQSANHILRVINMHILRALLQKPVPANAARISS